MSETESRPVTLIQTKLYRPQLRSDLVDRPRLLTRLACDVEHKVTLVSAPAGYGKTTLLAQWLEACSDPSAWLSLDENDNDLATFVGYLVSAIQTVYPDACAGVTELLHAPSDPPWDYVATVLVNELAALPDPLIVALDDYHAIHNLQIHQFLAQVIRYLPRQVHLAIASRADPPLALRRLRAGRELVEIRAHDLRFSEAETEAYLAIALGPELARESAALLERRTEGWIVGLHLASLWLRETGKPAEALADLGGDASRLVIEYLAGEVLARQSVEVQQFLLRTSILDRFCAELCDAVVGLPAGSSTAMLDALDRANLFSVSLGDPGGWYRYHHLFGEMLRAMLHARTGPDEIADLHCRASEWFAAHSEIEDALRHALAAGDVESAIQLVEENAYGLLNRLERHSLERWLSTLPREAIWHSPRLLIAQGWLFYRQARVTALDAVLDAAEACLKEGRDRAGTVDDPSVWGQVYALRSVTAYLVHEDFERSVVSAERALELLPITEPGARSIALGYWVVSKHALGDQEEAVRRLEQALGDPAPHGPHRIQMYHSLCIVHRLAGDLHRMLEATQQNLALAARLNHANAITGSHWLAGLLSYEWNDLGAAATHFAKILEFRYTSQFYTTFTAMLGLARIAQWQGEMAKAQQVIHSLRAETLRLDNASLLAPVDSIQADLWLQQGNTAQALRWARSLNVEGLLEPDISFELPSLTQARVLIAAGTDEEVRDVQRTLQDKLAAAKRRHHVQRAIPTLAHLALVHDRLGEVEEGLAALREALVLAEPGGFIRSFVDAGPRLRALLTQIEQPGVNPHYLSEILAAFDGAEILGRRPENLSPGPDSPLTPREEQILQLMYNRLTNKEIASELVISVHTVKRHATNIYHKLDVDGRRQAIRKAQRMGILPTD